MCSIYQNSTRTKRVPCNLFGSDGWTVSFKVSSLDGAPGTVSFFSPAVEAAESRFSASSGLGLVTWELDVLVCWAQLAGRQSSAIATHFASIYVLLIYRFRHFRCKKDLGFKLKLDCVTFSLESLRTSKVLHPRLPPGIE